MIPLLDDPAGWAEALLEAVYAAHRCKSPAAVAEVVEELLSDQVGDRAACLFHDPEDHTLWSATDPARAGSAASGICGAAVRDGRPLVALRADRDPRFVSAVDDPLGDGGALYAHPVGRPRAVHAVLVVARAAGRPPFTGDELERVATVAFHLGPVLEALELREASAPPTGPYRREAVAARARGDGDRAGLLHPVTPWVRRSYVLLAAVCVSGGLASAVVPVADHARGPCVVSAGGAAEVRAPATGLVARVHVAPGQAVAAGDPVVELADADGDAALERLRLEQELQLRNLLRDPTDRAAQQAVVAGRTERAYLEARRADRSIRAPFDGVVRQLWVARGQRVEAGQGVASVADRSSEGAASVFALLPSDALPYVREGASLELTVDGSPRPISATIVPPLPDGVLPADAARRLLGERAVDLPADGGVVVVHGRLSPADAPADGVPGTAELELRSVPLWVAAIPGMETLW